MHPFAIQNTKPIYDQMGMAIWSFCVFTKTPNDKGEIVESKHLPLWSFLGNRPHMRYGALSASWLATRTATAWGWVRHERRVRPESPQENYYLRGRIMTGKSGTAKEAPDTTHFLSFASEEMIPTWDTWHGIFNLHPIQNVAEPLSPGNAWAIKKVVTTMQGDNYLRGESESNNVRYVWLNGPPIDGSQEDPLSEEIESPYEKNRKLFYSLATDIQPVAVAPKDKQFEQAALAKATRPGTVVYWAVE